MEQMKKTIKEILISDLKDRIYEFQRESGYEKEVLYFYYSVNELNALLGTNAEDRFEMVHVLNSKCAGENCELGKLGFHIHKGKIEVSISLRR